MGDPFEGVMGPLGAVRARVEEAMAGQGLRVVQVAFVPALTIDGPHEVQVLAVLADTPPAGCDVEFERVVQEARQGEVDEQATRAVDELKERLQRGSGFLGDHDTGDA